MVERTVDVEILNSIEKYIKEISRYYKIDSIILFGSYAKGTNTSDSDIDIAVVSSDIIDKLEDMARLMRLRRNIDLRIEPHPIKTEEFRENKTPFIDEIIKTGIELFAVGMVNFIRLFSDEEGDFTKERQKMDITRDEFLKYAEEHGETII